MGTVPSQDRVDNPRILLDLLEAVQKWEAKSQRDLAARLGVALGLVNSYLNRSVKKGLLKVSQVPARRYAYYLTPKGFAEKSRLTTEFLLSSLGFFRAARADCAVLLGEAQTRGWRTLALAGASEIAEIAALCAMEAGLTVVAVIDASCGRERFIGVPVFARLGDLPEPPDGVLVTAITETQIAMSEAVAVTGEERVLVPALLRVGLVQTPVAPADSVLMPEAHHG